MSKFDNQETKSSHELYDEYKELDRKFIDALKAAKRKYGDPFSDRDTLNNLRELNDTALEAYRKWRDFRFNNSANIDLGEDE